MLKSLFHFLVATSFSLFVVACSSSTVIDEQSDIQDGLWHLDSLLAFQFEIEDTTLRIIRFSTM
ncbi:hypothetical protein [Reichenbachiella sp.]|uniref:hypothetical protein n=1 Tax=Reichenbachiella sp. TaxID=2184521 RepID=UPI003B59374A